MLNPPKQKINKNENSQKYEKAAYPDCYTLQSPEAKLADKLTSRFFKNSLDSVCLHLMLTRALP